MSKAIKTVASGGLNLLSGGVGSLVGGTSSKIADKLPGFKGSTRIIDKEAFKIKGAEGTVKTAKEREQAAANRSSTAQGQRQTLISQLQGQAAGTAPSLAEAQLKSASERNLAQQLAASQAQRGGSSASRERQLLRGQATAGRALAQDSAQARLAEQQSAQQLLGQQISQEQQASDQLTQQYMQLGFSAEQAQQQAAADLEKLETQQFISAQGLSAAGVAGQQQAAAGITGGLFGAAGSAMAMSDKKEKKKIKKVNNKDMSKALTAMSSETEKKNKKEDMFKLSSGVEKSNKKLLKTSGKVTKPKEDKSKDPKKAKAAKGIGEALKSGFDNAAAGFGEAKQRALAISRNAAAQISDKDEKKNKMSVKKDFLDKLKAYTYEYKNPEKPGAGHGTHMSVMAQDLEKTEIGKSMVQETEDGTKMVDYGKGFGAILAAQVHLNKRIEEIEKKSKKRK